MFHGSIPLRGRCRASAPDDRGHRAGRGITRPVRDFPRVGRRGACAPVAGGAAGGWRPWRRPPVGRPPRGVGGGGACGRARRLRFGARRPRGGTAPPAAAGGAAGSGAVGGRHLLRAGACRLRPVPRCAHRGARAPAAGRPVRDGGGFEMRRPCRGPGRSVRASAGSAHGHAAPFACSAGAGCPRPPRAPRGGSRALRGGEPLGGLALAQPGPRRLRRPWPAPRQCPPGAQPLRAARGLAAGLRRRSFPPCAGREGGAA